MFSPASSVNPYFLKRARFYLKLKIKARMFNYDMFSLPGKKPDNSTGFSALV